MHRAVRKLTSPVNLNHIFKKLGRNFLCSDTEQELTTEDMDLKSVVKQLNKFAPTSLAGSWDNVGLLVEPSPPHKVSSILLTNDLTEAVCKEALQKEVNMILSYHPPVFSPLKRLTQGSWKERIIVQCLENRVAVFSPHTSYDAVQGGVNDWLIKPFTGVSQPIEKVTAPQYPSAGGYRLEITLPHSLVEITQDMLTSIPAIPGVVVVSHTKLGVEEPHATRLSLNCTEAGLSKAVGFVNQFEGVKETMEVLQLVKPPVPLCGAGRLLSLESPLSVQAVVDKVKAHLGLEHVRLALAVDATLDSPVKKLAVCAGSGSSVLRGVCADLYLTGEMSHHEILEANHKRASVILCDHSNTERGFLKDHKVTLEELFDRKVTVKISEIDRDPLEIV